MRSNATAVLQGLPSRKVSGEGLHLSRPPARADSGRRSGAPSGSIVVIVIVVGAKATRLRVDRHFARLPIHGPGHFDISAVAGDDDFSRNESGCLDLLRVGDRQADASGK